MEKILIVTCKNDTHPNSVIELLNKKGIPFFRLNTESLLTDYSFAWCCTENGDVQFTITDDSNGKTINNSEIHSVWYRRPIAPEELKYSYDEKVDYHNLKEAKSFYFYLMYYLSDFYSIGNHFRDKKANSKFVQHQLAGKLGMKMPMMCISNNKNLLSQAMREYESLIIKPLGDYSIWYDGDNTYQFYATKVQTDELLANKEESFSQTVNFCENYIEKKYELRITVMGNHVFACKLDSQRQKNDTGKIDWRQGYENNLVHQMIECPQNISRFCKDYLSHLKLNFGCFDFIVTPEDDYVFLECNPNGQWGWIEDDTAAPMSEALVDCLIHYRHPLDE